MTKTVSPAAQTAPTSPLQNFALAIDANDPDIVILKLPCGRLEVAPGSGVRYHDLDVGKVFQYDVYEISKKEFGQFLCDLQSRFHDLILES